MLTPGVGVAAWCGPIRPVPPSHVTCFPASHYFLLCVGPHTSPSTLLFLGPPLPESLHMTGARGGGVTGSSLKDNEGWLSTLRMSVHMSCATEPPFPGPAEKRNPLPPCSAFCVPLVPSRPPRDSLTTHPLPTRCQLLQDWQGISFTLMSPVLAESLLGTDCPDCRCMFVE